MNTRFDPNEPRGGTKSTDRTGPGPGQPMSGTEARQGRAGFPVLKVLIAALVLLGIAWGVAEIWGEATEPPVEQTATPPAGDTTPANQEAQPTADPADAPTRAPLVGGATAD
ncbi:hypothetical protein ABID21_000597 [Pseudorhizobium tarimense]|uniref:Uncharacterized protein n=1 Tax=Pseudorhizobium tarimense TaxID=1079109 RepID=A0ABV2H1S5_9HYPH|nr:hypothetical protein [Pseudorhizobium tarimense]MCJ8517885.1 hypothetical protein [Pseudorhizobium tarimense]